VTGIAEAARVIASGRVAVIPTDTVYGLAASPARPDAVAALFELKGRPRSNPIPILAGDLRALEGVADFHDRARRIGERFWPGPLTIVLPRAPGFDVELGGDGATVAVRVPDHAVALDLLHRTGPLAVTSANLSGGEPVTTGPEAGALFGSAVVVVDGGPCDGDPSTIVDLTGHLRVLREGLLTPQVILQDTMS
jgi:L-threonylcarbamoyladenylate synthase